jgi:hypothetical protein
MTPHCHLTAAGTVYLVWFRAKLNRRRAAAEASRVAYSSG